jgi:hypothetical protein
MHKGHESFKQYVAAGSMLLFAGMLLLLGQFFKTDRLTLLVFPLIGLGLTIFGLVFRSAGWMITGILVMGAGLSIFLFLFMDMPLIARLGLALMVFACSWILATFQPVLFQKKVSWWALVPAAALGGLGFPLWRQSDQIIDYVFYLLLLLGVSFLIWGTIRKIFGLIIPGCLLSTIGPGVYFSWGTPPPINILAQTGIMLAWFALGWGLITLFSRRMFERIAWWPLIPGGILAVTGWGLYIGGDPGSAVNFIGNTGTVGVIIFGLYLVLMRRGIRQ